MQHVKIILALCQSAWCAAALAAASYQDKPAALPSDPEFEATLIDGTKVSGRIGSLAFHPNPTGSIELVGATTESIQIAKVVKLIRKNPPQDAGIPRGSLTLFPDGDRLYALLGKSDGDSVVVSPGVLSDKPTKVPLDHVVAFIFDPPKDITLLSGIVDRARNRPRESDVIWLLNGDVQPGGFQSIDANHIGFEQGTTVVKYERNRVEALGFDPGLLTYDEPKAPRLEFTFLDGSRLGVLSCKLNGGTIHATTRFGASIDFAVNSIARVYAISDRIAFLSDRDPTATQFVAYLDRHPQRIGRNTTWDGKPIQLAGRSFDRGLGMLPRSLVAYALDPNDTRFQATIGMNDSAGELSDVVFRVLVDRTEVFASPPIRSGSAPVAVDVSVAGGKLLVLVVEFGERGDVQDSAVWADARLVRTSANAP